MVCFFKHGCILTDPHWHGMDGSAILIPDEGNYYGFGNLQQLAEIESLKKQRDEEKAAREKAEANLRDSRPVSEFVEVASTLVIADKRIAAAEKREQEALAQVAVLVEAITAHINENSVPKMDGSRAFPRVSERELGTVLANIEAAARKFLEEREAERRVVEAAVRVRRAGRYDWKFARRDLEQALDALAALDARKAGE